MMAENFPAHASLCKMNVEGTENSWADFGTGGTCVSQCQNGKLTWYASLLGMHAPIHVNSKCFKHTLSLDMFCDLG